MKQEVTVESLKERTEERKRLTARTLNVHDLLAHPRLVVTREALGVVREVWGDDR